MKKLTEKKVNVFGKEVSVFLIAMVAVLGFGSAALVPYLSGLVTGDVGVNSPVALYIADDGDVSKDYTWDTTDVPSSMTGDAVDFGEIKGGTTESFWIKADNDAEVAADGWVVFEITCDEGLNIDGSDIQDFAGNVRVYDWANSGTTEVEADAALESAFTVYGVDGNTARIYRESYLFADGSGDTIYANVDLEFAINAIGNYDIKAAFIYDDGVINPETADFPTA